MPAERCGHTRSRERARSTDPGLSPVLSTRPIALTECSLEKASERWISASGVLAAGHYLAWWNLLSAQPIFAGRFNEGHAVLAV